MEFFFAHRAAAASGPLLGRLIVDLHACHIGISRKSPGQFLRNFHGILPVRIMIIAVMPSAAKRTAYPAIVHVQNIRMFFYQPCGRAGRGSTQNGHNPRLSQLLHGLLQPFKVKFPLLRLHPAPGKLSHPHRVYARLFQQFQVCPQIFLRLMFRIVRYTISHPVLFSGVRHFLSMPRLSMHCCKYYSFPVK